MQADTDTTNPKTSDQLPLETGSPLRLRSSPINLIKKKTDAIEHINPGLYGRAI